MKVLLAAVNAKYIHSNLGIYSLKAYADKTLMGRAEVELAEYTINHQRDLILQDIFRRKPDVIGFSCYIWNIEYVKAVAADLRKVRPSLPIWLGGPEVSYDAGTFLAENPYITGIMRGEGEETFAQLLCCYVDNWSANFSNSGKLFGSSSNALEPDKGLACFYKELEQIPGLLFRLSDGVLADTGIRAVMDLSDIPFPYCHVNMSELEHRIVYYESSRGCPFSCSYCLSSIDKTVRFRDLKLVKEELSFFLAAGVPQVKFVDRTFNCKKSHAMAVWQFIQEHDNGVTNFHFEIAADLLDGEALALLGKMRSGLVQLEIGVQSTNQDTLKAIRRRTDIDKIRGIVSAVNSGRNIHQHLDLIAGLPYEDLESFRNSFNQVYSMEPEQLQLGFLKVLKGSYMEEASSSYALAFSSCPPYEILSTRWISYQDILELKGVEEMVEVYYNSKQFTTTIQMLGREYDTPYEMFLDMADYYQGMRLDSVNHSRIARYEILYRMIERTAGLDKMDPYRDSLITDLYLRENIKKRPFFACDQTQYKNRIRDFFKQEEANPRYLTRYGGYDYRQMLKMAHVEALSDGRMVLFDYMDRDPLTSNARMYEL